MICQILELALQSWGCRVCAVQTEDEAIRELVDAGSLSLESTLPTSTEGLLLDSEVEAMELFTKVLGQQPEFQNRHAAKELGLNSLKSGSETCRKRCRGMVGI